MKSRETDEEQPDPLDALESFAELFGFIFKDTGEEGLHNFFAVAEEHGRHQSRESLEEAADELEEIGMTKPAAILREYAKKSPRTALQIEQDKYWAACPYPRDTPKARAWSHREWEQSRQGRQGLCPWCRLPKAPKDACDNNLCIEKYRQYLLSIPRGSTPREKLEANLQKLLGEYW